MKPRISLRVNGARIGAAARPVTDEPQADVISPAPSQRLGLRVRPALSTKPNDYMPDDEVGS